MRRKAAAAIPMEIRDCAAPSWRRVGRACPTTTSSAPSNAAPAKGTDAQHFDEIIYEGYAPGGVAVIVEAATDNKNRTAAEIRSIFTKNHGNLGIERKRFLHVSSKRAKSSSRALPSAEERIFELALEAGAEELTTEEEQYVITTSHDQLYAVAEALKKAGVTTEGQKFTFIPDTTVPVADESVALQVLRLCDALEDDDDVQNVYSNLDIPDEVAGQIAGLKLS